ncbi:hypothetical protein [Pseudodesulfovibrio sp. zrk46]|uniref:hypothetical protein n=1 Tax=Pseudodesulfovibrio sp. zrk46 TaxID=2725288 RepID=UPI00144959CB|nr:hypothetical protein [Pseudodesulfovibrio sp. zrk46]QJB56532.1 hypothetical protein HFN16_08975 [Pseudodesulfovibrio sp. zrk46]
MFNLASLTGGNFVSNLDHYPRQLTTSSLPPELSVFNGNGQSVQDKVRLFEHIREEVSRRIPSIVASLLPGGWRTGSVYTNGYFKYVLVAFESKMKVPIRYDDQTLAGYGNRDVIYLEHHWWNEKTGASGVGVFSLACHIHQVDRIEAFRWILNGIDIEIESCVVQQASLPENVCYVSTPIPYGSILLPDHPYLGIPFNEYCFVTENGAPSFFAREWIIDGEKVLLFLTPCLVNGSGMLEWKYALPPVENMLFNKGRLFNEASLPVDIYDDLGLAARNASLPYAVATWAGEKSFSAAMDWSPLAGRVVNYIFDPNDKAAVEIGAELRGVFQGMGVDLKLVYRDELPEFE